MKGAPTRDSSLSGDEMPARVLARANRTSGTPRGCPAKGRHKACPYSARNCGAATADRVAVQLEFAGTVYGKVSRKGAKYAKGAKQAKTKALHFLCVLCAFA
jgi:hypothetical protein